MKKSIAIVLGIILYTVSVFAQSSRDFVCRIVPSENDVMYRTLNKLAEGLVKQKYDTEAEKLSSYISTRESTGFVISDDAGKKYVITSSTRLSDFSLLDIDFATPQNFSLHDLKPSAVDKNLRLLLIELPESYSGKSIKAGTMVLTEGQKIEIPDFTGKHWENQSAFISNINEGKTYFTHSNRFAPPGSPALIPDPSSDSGYRLAGVNRSLSDSSGSREICTEKTSGVHDFVQSWRNSVYMDEDIPLNLFIDMVKSKDGELASRFVSAELLSERGVDIFLSDMSYEYRNKLKDEPCKALSLLASERIKKIFAPYKSISVSKIKTDGDCASVVFDVGTKEIESLWTKNQGLWKLSDLDGLDEKKSPKKNTAPGFMGFDGWAGDPFVLNIRGSYLLPSTIDGGGFDVTALASLQLFGIGFFYQQESLEMETSSGTQKRNAHSFGGIARLQLPLNLWRFMLVPYIEGRLGFTNVHEVFGDKSSRLYFGANFGMDLAFVINEYIAPYISFSGNTVNYNGNENSNNFSFSAGLRLLGIIDFSAL